VGGFTRCYAHLGDLERFGQEFAKVKQMDPQYPKVESSKNYLIYRNFNADSLCAKKNFARALVEMNICNREEEVIFTNLGLCSQAPCDPMWD
jgi:hypothetical protein